MLVGVMLVMTLASCSSYGKIKSNFKSEGYIELESEDNSTAKTITAELEKGNISCTVHFLQRKSGDDASALDKIADAATTVIILEFSSDKEIVEAVKESGTLSGIIGDLQKSEYVRDNCVLIPLINTAAKDIFNK
jgi:hypothetical protein